MGGNYERGSSGGGGKLWEVVGKLGEITEVVMGKIRGVDVQKIGLRGN